MFDSSDSESVEMFNHASQLSKAGRHAQALEAWDELLLAAPFSMTRRFHGLVLLRKAWTLMDLTRYKDARRVFESDQMQACLSTFTMAELYDCYSAHGYVLGELGAVEEMDHLISRALGLAIHDLGDTERAKDTWLALLGYATRARAWGFVLEEVDRAGAFARRQGSRELSLRVRWYRALALKNLERIEEARQEAESLLVSSRRAGQLQAVHAVEAFIASL